MTTVSAVDFHGRQWDLVPIQDVICAMIVADSVAIPTVLSEQLLAECPLVISAQAPTLSVGAREKLTDVIDLVVANPETASVEQIREVASLARLLLRRHPA
ncbi:hypothetical protein CJ179_10705 [Rhodococcus sp. ACS1]|uniref:hypothetical protein n=1 Tax=Rhodococcus sp. ACS1 TaxID=2028570 RepID=UPI000BB12AC8|nr:hypothetical protein [Rhodococcus sp. ACS1]PBC50068.1 hypothetical protein CJ179_10705 [Rhodococcus sp. ACS1]